MSKSLLDTNVDSIEDIRNHPSGRYEGKVVSVKFGEYEDKQTVDLAFRATAALDDQDLSGVEMNRMLYHRIWLSADNLRYVKRDLARAGVDLTSGTLRDSISNLEGADVEMSVGIDDYDKKKGRDIPKVLTFRLV